MQPFSAELLDGVQQTRPDSDPAAAPGIPEDLATGEPLFRCAMLSIIRHYARCADEADELYQVAWLALLNAAPRYRDQGARIHWVRAVTRRSCAKWRRDQRRYAGKIERFRESLPELETEVPSDLTAAIPDAARLTMDDVYDAAVALPPRRRTVFLMRVYEDHDIGALADLLGVTDGCIKATFFQARKDVLERLGHTRTVRTLLPAV